jgi:subtilisin-like proprotein convertase family protein
MLAVGCLTAGMCIPTAVFGQLQPRSMSPDVGKGGSDQPIQSPDTVFEFVLMDGATRVTGSTVLCVENGNSQIVVCDAAGVFSMTNPPDEFQLVVERANAAPVIVKMAMPESASQPVNTLPTRRSPNSDTFAIHQAFSANDLVRGVVNITDSSPSISILEPGSGFDKADTALLTKSGFVPRPIEAGAGRAGDGCVDATPIACGGTETFTLQAFNAEPVPLTSSCELAVGGPFTHDKSVWFEFTPNATTAQISMCVSDSEQDSVMTLFTPDSTCGALTEFDCNDDGCPDIVNPNGFGAPDLFVGGLNPGDTYFILIDFYSGGHDLPDDGTFDVDNTITITCGVALPTGACCANDGGCTEDEEADCVSGGGTYQGDNTTCGGVVCPVLAVNETCESAIVVDAVPFASAVDNDLSIPNGPAGSCDGFGATGMMQNDIWYEWTADQDCLLDMSVTSSYDSILVVRDNCTDLNELICIDDTGFGFPEAGQISVTNGTTYFFQIGDNGSFETGGLTQFNLSCFANTGACCVGKGCSIETEADCAGMGGTYVGNDTICEGPPLGNPVSFDSSPNVAIPDNNPAGVDDVINVGDSFELGDVNVSIQVDHTFLGDLDITLTHNGTTSSLIMADACGTNADMDITIDDAAGNVVCAEPLLGTFNSDSLNGEGLSIFNGENSAGTWTLNVVDDAGIDTGTLLSWSIELDGAGPGPCDDEPEPTCTPDACPDGTTPIVGVENGNFAGWCVSGAPTADVDFFFFRVDYAGDFALIEITKEFTQGPEAPTGLIPPILVTFFQVCDDADTVGSIIIGEESVRNSTGVDWTDYHWSLFDANEVWFDVAASSQWSTLPFVDKEFASFLDEPANTKAKSLNADNGVVPNNSQYFPGSGTGVLKMDVDLSGPPVNFTFKQRPTIDGTPDPDGACCIADVCQILTEADCNSQSGTYQGDDASCTPDPCATPTGACCNDDGSCSGDLTQGDCEAGGGTYQGDDSDCGSVSCPVQDDGDVCTAAIEIFNGLNMGTIVDGGVDDPDPSCTPSGSDDTWFMYTATTAGSLLIETCGTYADAVSEVDTIVAVYDGCGGTELDCDDDCTTGGNDPNAPCKDAPQEGTGTRDSCVCVDTVNIGDEFWIQVQEFGGNNAGDISITVTPNGCGGAPPVTGGCCNDDGSCDDVAGQAACDGQGGTYQGDDVLCASVSCPVVGTGNDECEDRGTLACGATTFVDMIDATNGAGDLPHSCSTSVNPCSEYHEFVPTGTSARIRTDLNSTADDSVFTLYQVDQGDPCNKAAWSEVGCSEDEGASFLGDICVDGLTPGDSYIMMITGFAAFRCDDGPYGIDIDCSATCGP